MHLSRFINVILSDRSCSRNRIRNPPSVLSMSMFHSLNNQIWVTFSSECQACQTCIFPLQNRQCTHKKTFFRKPLREGPNLQRIKSIFELCSCFFTKPMSNTQNFTKHIHSNSVTIFYLSFHSQAVSSNSFICSSHILVSTPFSFNVSNFPSVRSVSNASDINEEYSDNRRSSRGWSEKYLKKFFFSYTYF